MLRSPARSCSEQLRLRTQVAQRKLCWERIICTVRRRSTVTLGLPVKMVMPSATTLLQAVSRRSVPTISTAHTRHAAISFRSFKKQRWGMAMPTDSAACMMVVFAGTVTGM